MMKSLLEALVSLVAAGSVATMLVLGLRLLPAASLLPATWRYRMSKIAAWLYLVPIAVAIPWLSQPIVSLTSLNESLTVAKLSQATVLPKITIAETTVMWLFIAWSFGAVVFVAWQMYCYWRFKRLLRNTSSWLTDSSEATKRLDIKSSELHVKQSVRVASSSAISSPILVGLWRPTIYLPVGKAMPVSLDLVLHHELIHLKQKDLWMKMILLAVSSLHWFNPLSHVLRKEAHLWSELSCDEEVVRSMPLAERKRYGLTILHVSAEGRHLPTQFCASLSGEGEQLKRRLAAMIQVKKASKQTIAMAVVGLLLVGGVGTVAATWTLQHAPAVVVAMPEAVEPLVQADMPEQSEPVVQRVNSATKPVKEYSIDEVLVPIDPSLLEENAPSIEQATMPVAMTSDLEVAPSVEYLSYELIPDEPLLTEAKPAPAK